MTLPFTEPSPQRLHQLLDRFQQACLVVWGDLVVDEFLMGEANRISREAPVLILEYQQSEFVPGGGGNTVAGIAALGAKAIPVGFVGQDRSGDALLKMLQARNIDIAGIQRVPDFLTPTKTRVSGAGLHTTRQQIVRIDRGRPHHPSESQITALKDALHSFVAQAHGMVVVDYGFNTVEPGLARRLAAILRPAGKFTVADS
ncbi:MAG: bifunctional heptose 7-phosphate kinase/heptose 1-phosphate adenyltransferase, partial [Acidobacteriota bacterium]